MREYENRKKYFGGTAESERSVDRRTWFYLQMLHRTLVQIETARGCL